MSETESPSDAALWRNWSPPGLGDVRSPCPFVNTLANHSLLPHSGRAIDRTTLHNALTSPAVGAHYSREVADIFVDKAFSLCARPGEDTIDLGRLNAHGVIEHDVSMSRDDAALGDNAKFSWERWKEALDEMLAGNEEEGVVRLGDAMRARYMRLKQAQKRHEEVGERVEYGLREAFLGIGEQVLWLNVLSDGDQVPVEYLRVFFEQQRMPYTEGWRPRDSEFTQQMFKGSMWALVKAHPHKLRELWIIMKGTARAAGRKIASWFGCGDRSSR